MFKGNKMVEMFDVNGIKMGMQLVSSNRCIVEYSNESGVYRTGRVSYNDFNNISKGVLEAIRVRYGVRALVDVLVYLLDEVIEYTKAFGVAENVLVFNGEIYVLNVGDVAINYGLNIGGALSSVSIDISSIIDASVRLLNDKLYSIYMEELTGGAKLADEYVGNDVMDGGVEEREECRDTKKVVDDFYKALGLFSEYMGKSNKGCDGSCSHTGCKSGCGTNSTNDTNCTDACGNIASNSSIKEEVNKRGSGNKGKRVIKKDGTDDGVQTSLFSGDEALKVFYEQLKRQLGSK